MTSRTPVVDKALSEAMRIAGEKVHSDRVIEIRYPYTGEVVATVPKASLQDVRRDRPLDSPAPPLRAARCRFW